MKIFLNLIDKKSNERDDILIEKLGTPYKKILSITGVLVLFLVIVSIIPLFLRYLSIEKNKEEPEFNLVSIQKKEAREVDSLSGPIITASTVQNWTGKALRNSFSFNFYQMNESFTNNKKYFTADGWNAFYAELGKSKMLENVTDKQLVVWLTLLQDPYVISSYKVGDYVVWDVETTALITYIGASAPTNQKVIVSIKVLQVPTTESPYGIQISKINMM